MKASTYIIVVLAVIITLATCTDKSLNPIFYTLENERSLAEDRGLEDDMTVHQVVKVGTRYFAAANQLYSRTVTGNWTKIDPPVSGALCNVIESYGANYIYAGFFTKDGTGLGLYRTDPTAGGWTPQAPSWDNTFDPEVIGIQIGLIKSIGTNLYVVTAQQNGVVTDYYLYESTNGTTYTGTEVTFDAVSPINVPITDVEDQAGTLWVTAGPLLYSGVLGSLAAVVGGPTNPGTYPFGGLLYTTKLYVSTKDGELWSYTGTWAGPTSIDVDGEAVRFTRFVDVTAVSTDVIVGTEGRGYYELVGGDETNTVRRPDYNISGLYKGGINSFFLDAAESSLFACTTGAGLWRADYTAGDWLWFQE